jgi:hypothetical protein
VKREQLLKFCETNKIAIPKSATLEQINAAIVRSSLHNTKVENTGETCFGFWENENGSCATCDFESKCFRASFGMEREAYMKQMENLEKPRFYKKPLAKFKKAKV